MCRKNETIQEAIVELKKEVKSLRSDVSKGKGMVQVSSLFRNNSSNNNRCISTKVKYLLVLYMCSLTTGQCPSSSISGYQFTSHYDCINAGCAVAQKTFRNLQELEEWDTS